MESSLQSSTHIFSSLFSIFCLLFQLYEQSSTAHNLEFSIDLKILLTLVSLMQ